MKRIFASLMAIMLIFGMCAIYASAAESFQLAITEYDGVALEEGDDIYAQVYVYPTDGAERVVTSEEFNLRYVFVLVCDKDGVVLEAGNNLFKSSDPRANEFPQHDVTAPAGGHVVTFYYNASNPMNQKAYDFYNELLTKFAATTDVYNETAKLTDCTYTVTYKDSAVTFTKDAIEAAPDTSDEESSDASDEASDESADVSDESSAAASSEDTSSAASSEASATTSSATSSAASSDASSVADDADGSNAWIWIVAAVAVVAIAAVAVVIAKKKK